MILSSKWILGVIKKNIFKNNYIKVLKELTLHIDKNRTNVIIEL